MHSIPSSRELKMKRITRITLHWVLMKEKPLTPFKLRIITNETITALLARFAKILNARTVHYLILKIKLSDLLSHNTSKRLR